MAKFGKVGIISQSMHLQPPAPQQWSDERCCQGTDIDEDVENLETGVTLSLSPLQFLRSLLGGTGFEVVIHLTDDGLKVAFEQTVSTSDECKSEDGEWQEPGNVAGCGQDGNSQEDITQCHHYEAPCDRPFVVLGTVGDDATHEAEHIDGGEEHGGDETTLAIGEAEFRTQEEREHGVHDIVSEPLSHIA